MWWLISSLTGCQVSTLVYILDEAEVEDDLKVIFKVCESPSMYQFETGNASLIGVCVCVCVCVLCVLCVGEDYFKPCAHIAW